MNKWQVELELSAMEYAQKQRHREEMESIERIAKMSAEMSRIKVKAMMWEYLFWAAVGIGVAAFVLK